MITVILVAHIMVSIVLIIVVLMQRSEGGALGIGGGGGAGGGLMTGSGVKGALVRTTIIFGAIFFVTSLGLTTLATQNDRGGITEIEENLENEFGGDTGEDALGVGTLDALDDLRKGGSELSDDPLAISPAPSAETAPIEDTTSDQPVDPLADPQ
ncbi:MAG: hypothetical protein Hens3KO_07580 [Henriciella sp.]